MENSNIKNILASIEQNLSKEGKKRKDALDNSLKARMEKANFDEKKYINSLKFNLIFYKSIIRNVEFIVGKWLENKNIPSKEQREDMISQAVEESKGYIQNATKTNGKTLITEDIKTLSKYKNLIGSELKEALESEYRFLNIYNDVIRIFINEIDKINLETLKCENNEEILSFIKLETKNTSNSILKSSSKISFEKKDPVVRKENVPLTLDQQVFQQLNHLTSLELYIKMDEVYNECCKMENINDNKISYKFGKIAIKEYISSVILLDLVKEREAKLIKGAIRLLIVGEFGANNFVDFIDNIILKELKIKPDTCEEAMSIINSKFNQCTNNYLSEENTKDSKFIDIEEYIYILDNADFNASFRKEAPKSDSGNSSHEGSNSKEAPTFGGEYKPKKSGNKAVKIIGLLLILGLVTGGVFYFGTLQKDKNKKEDTPKDNPPATIPVDDDNKEEDNEASETTNDSSEYYLKDSDSRFLTLNELSAYTEEELGYIRNEIYARHGFIFADGKYKDHFKSTSWYYEDSSFSGDSDELNEYEVVNAELVRLEEANRKSSSLKIDNSYHKVHYDTASMYYSVYSESFSDRSNAASYVDELDDKNIDAFVVEEDDYYRVRVGSAYSREMAEGIVDELQRKSINAFILAYDEDVQNKIDNLYDTLYYGNANDFESEYYTIKQEIKEKKYYANYLDKLEKLYENA